MDKGIKLQKELAMNVASKSEKVRSPGVKVVNKMCKGGAVMAPTKRKK